MTTTFQAGAQYGDWAGDASADEGDFISIRDYLRDNNLITQNEFLVGIKFWNGENLQNQPVTPVRATAILIPAANHAAALAYLNAADPVPVREVQFEMTLEEFFGRFKRFSVALGARGLNFTGMDIETI